jgi:hypothetical protein
MSIEAWIERAVIDRLDTDEGAAEFFRRRAQGATGDGLSALLALAPHAPPMPGDELPEGWSASEAGLGAR